MSKPDKNTILNTCFVQKQINAWCRISDYVLGTGALTKITYFGQLNYCFRLLFQHDRTANGLAFANVVLRKPTFDINRCHHYISADDKLSYNPNKQFISLNYIDSSALGICGLDEGGMPIVSPFIKQQWKLDISYLLYSTKQLNRLYFIELHPERLVKIVAKNAKGDYVDDAFGQMTTDYRTILHDEDATKAFEECEKL